MCKKLKNAEHVPPAERGVSPRAELVEGGGSIVAENEFLA